MRHVRKGCGDACIVRAFVPRNLHRIDSQTNRHRAAPTKPEQTHQGKIGPKAKLSDVVTVLEPKEELDIPVPEPAAAPAVSFGAPAAPTPVY